MKLLGVKFDCSIKFIVRWFSARLILVGVILKIQCFSITNLFINRLILRLSLVAFVNIFTILLFQIQIVINWLWIESICKSLPSPISFNCSEFSYIGISMTVLSLSPVLLQQVSIYSLHSFTSQSLLSKRRRRVHESKFLGFWWRYDIVNIIWNHILLLWWISTQHWIVLSLN